MKLLGILWAIISFIIKIFKKEPENNDQKRLELDHKLAIAIKEGNVEEIQRIRELLKNYKTLLIILFCGVLLSGCGMFKPAYQNIPLTQGNEIYRLKPGSFIDDKNQLHVETNFRYSVSEQDLYQNTRQIRDNKSTNTIESKIKEYLPYLISL